MKIKAYLAALIGGRLQDNWDVGLIYVGLFVIMWFCFYELMKEISK